MLQKETTTFWADCVDRFLLKNNHCHTLVMDMDVSKYAKVSQHSKRRVYTLALLGLYVMEETYMKTFVS